MLVKNKAGRMYVGEVLDILKKVGGRYASVDDSPDGKGITNLSLLVFLPLHPDSQVCHLKCDYAVAYLCFR